VSKYFSVIVAVLFSLTFLPSSANFAAVFFIAAEPFYLLDRCVLSFLACFLKVFTVKKGTLRGMWWSFCF